jgi:hypothetical protein
MLTLIIINNNNNVNDENFVISSSSVTSSSSDTSNNVVSVTTPNFVPPEMEITVPSCTFTPCFQETSDTPPHSPSFDDDEEAATMYRDLITSTK